MSVVQVPRGTHYAGDDLAGITIGLIAERVSNAAINSAVQWAERGFAKRQRGISDKRQRGISDDDATPIIRRAVALSSPRIQQNGEDVRSS